MQAGGQFGVPEVQQFVVGRSPPSQGHMFTGLSHDVSVSTSSAAHGHAQRQTQHPQHQQLQLNNANSDRQQQEPLQLQHSHHSNPQPTNHQHLQLPHHMQVSQQQQTQMLASKDSFGEEEGLDDGERSAGCLGNRWPRQETLALIRVRSEMDSAFRNAALKGPLWEEISRKLVELGYPRSARKCKEKFENIHKYYKKVKDGTSARLDGKSYRFFSELEALYGDEVSTLNGGGRKSEATLEDAGVETLKLKGAGYVSAAVDKVSMAHRLVENYGDVNMSSATSEDDCNDSAGMDEPHSRKRKRKSWNSRMTFFENLMKKYIDKQESILRKFLDVIERHEQNRVAREDAYRRQEIERASREEALRTQEHAIAVSRDAAIIALLQKTTGQPVNLPQIKPNVSASRVQEELQDNELFYSNCKRWPRPEVVALIQLRSDMEPKFHEAGPKGPLWEDIANRMASFGYSRNSKRCKEKWENINKYYRKTKDISKKRSENSKTCPYFHQLDALYRSGVLGTSNSKTLKLEDNPDERSESNKDASCRMEAEVDTAANHREADAAGAKPTSNCNSIHCFSDEAIGCGSETGLKKGQQTVFSESGRSNVGSCHMLEVDGLHVSGKLSENVNKSAKFGSLVKEMFGIQQRHHRIFDGYDEKDTDSGFGKEDRRQGSPSMNNFAQQDSH